MYCPRLDHFVRFNPSGTISRCGHMVNPVEFNNLTELENSQWLTDIKQQFQANNFPKEGIRCQQSEMIDGKSIRTNAIQYHLSQPKLDYLIVGGVLDNICNSACQMCNEHLSTKIGKLTNNVIVNNNIDKFWQLPLHRVTQLDINGGEPSVSKNYREILLNIPSNVESIRINTNGAVLIHELPGLIERGVKVTVTLSFDGIGLVHDYVRYPIKWDIFYKNLMLYKEMKNLDLNLWTTVSALNVGNLNDITAFANKNEINHSYSFLSEPQVLDAGYVNKLTTSAKSVMDIGYIASKTDNNSDLVNFITKQDMIRNINYKDYLGIDL